MYFFDQKKLRILTGQSISAKIAILDHSLHFNPVDQITSSLSPFLFRYVYSTHNVKHQILLNEPPPHTRKRLLN